MDIQYYGGNCVVISNKRARIVVDDNLTELGAKSIAKEGDLAIFTGAHGTPSKPPKIIIDRPGEYEVSDISIYGVAARAHMDETGKKTTTMYKIINDELKILVTGHVYPELTDAQLEAVGMVDVMLIPIGGHGYTLDAVGALQLIKKVEPKLVVPTHYADPALQYPVPQAPLEEALSGLAMEPKEKVAKLHIKPAELSDITQLVVLERS